VLYRAGRSRDGESVVVVAAGIMAIVLEASGAGSNRRSDWMAPDCAVAGEEFDGRAEPVVGRAPDHDAFDRAIGRFGEEPAHDLGGQRASGRRVIIGVCRAVKESHRGLR